MRKMQVTKKPRRSHHARVTDGLGRQIVRGSIGVGELLPADTELTARLSVSRTVLREALRTLSAKGMIESKQRIGTRVTDRRRWNLLDEEVIGWHVLEQAHHPDLFRQIVESRLVIEPVAAALAARRGQADHLNHIETALAEMISASADLDRYLKADILFHRAIYDSAGNELLGRMGNVLITALHLSHSLTSQVPDAIGRSLPLHVAVVDGIRRGSETAARRSMEKLIQCVVEDLEATLNCRLEIGPI